MELMSEQMRAESEGFQRFLADMDKWENRRWYASRLFDRLEKRLQDRRRKKYGNR